MKRSCAALSLCLLSLASSCSKPAAGGMHATVILRDGKTLTGTVVSSSASEIQLSTDDHVNQTIPMAQVRSVDYDTAVATPVADNSTPPPAPTPVATSSAPPAAQPQPPPVAAPPPAQAQMQPPPPPPNYPAERHENHYHPVEAAVTTKTFILPAGTQISVRNEETIDSRKAVEGQTFAAEVTADASDAAGNVVIPRGSNAQIVIRSATKGQRFRGASDLVMDLASISVDGREYAVSTADLSQRGRAGVGANRRTGEFAGGGAAFGAIVGAIAGGGKGAAIGLGSGAAAGALTQVLTKGTIKVPAETILTFKLDQALHITAAE